LQGARWLGDTYLAYGLGNSVCWRSNYPAAVTTGVLNLTVDDTGALQEPATRRLTCTTAAA
jgi:poly-gamma-glutamate synthesis protein (capsule biosynthesis protein)